MHSDHVSAIPLPNVLPYVVRRDHAHISRPTCKRCSALRLAADIAVCVCAPHSVCRANKIIAMPCNSHNKANANRNSSCYTAYIRCCMTLHPLVGRQFPLFPRSLCKANDSYKGQCWRLVLRFMCSSRSACLTS